MRLRWMIIAIVAALYTLSAGTGAFSAESSGNATAAASLADLARTVLARADEDALSSADRRDLLAALYGLAGADPLLHTPESNAALGRVILRSTGEAQGGDPDFLTALMMMPVSPYGGTVEGAEWINELLWEILGAQPQASIDALAALPSEIRDLVVARVYTAPVHDGFDFAALLAAQERVRIPAGFEGDHGRILQTLRGFAP